MEMSLVYHAIFVQRWRETAWLLQEVRTYQKTEWGFSDTFKFKLRVGKGIFVSREWSIFVRVKCMLDFSVVKCDLFYSRDCR
jgi:hypothetical protein